MSKPVSVIITKSDRKDKKLKAVFKLENDKTNTIHFGAKGYEDYTIHKDDKRKENYISRHKTREDWNNPMTAGALSRYVLWNKKSLNSSINDFKKRFGLK